MLAAVISAIAVSAVSLAAGMTVRTRLARHPVAADPAARARLPHQWRSVTAAVLRPDQAIAVLAVWLMLLDTGLALAAPWPVQFVVDYVIGTRPLPSWLAGLRGLPNLWLAGIAAAAGLVLVATAALASYLVTFLSGVLSERMTLRLRAGLFAHLLHAAPGSVAQYPLGELTARTGPDARQVTDTVGAIVQTLIPDAALLTGMTIIAARLDWRLTLVVLAVVPLYSGASRLRNRSLRAAQARARARSGELAALTADQLARLPAIHVFGQRSAELTRHTDAAARSAGAALAALDAGARFRPVTETLPGLGLAAVLIAGTIEVSSGRLTIGGLLVFLAYLSSLTGPIQSLAMLSATVARGQASRDRLADLLELPELEPMPPARASQSRPEADRRRSRLQELPRRGVAVRLDQVTYSPCPGRPILDRVSFSLRVGGLTCLTGPSGAGKSTLLSLLLRLADPQSGRIFIDGEDIAGLPLGRLRQLVTQVPQDPWLHSGTIADNIAYGRPGATTPQIVAAAEHAGVSMFASQLPSRYRTAVGEHGRLLSGGQQRRIALARALLCDTPLLLLDEPTVGLDPAAEAEVINSVLAVARGKTLLLVTHNPKLAELADDVIRLDNGQVADANQSAADKASFRHERAAALYSPVS
jgi:ATP-binding cassette subfamily B protein